MLLAKLLPVLLAVRLLAVHSWTYRCGMLRPTIILGVCEQGDNVASSLNSPGQP